MVAQPSGLIGGTEKAFITGLLQRAVDAADPAQGIAASLPAKPAGRTVVIGAGKASAEMARAFEAVWDGPLSGLVVTRYGHAVETRRIEVVEASHPVPDAAGLAATRRIAGLLDGLTADDLVVALMSGGASALLPSPYPPLTLDDEQAINRALLASGMPIEGMNKLRNAFSTVKGGRLAARAHPARVHTYVVSDVAGDDPALVGSGPTIPIAGTRAEIRDLVRLYRLDLPAAAKTLLASEDNLPPAPGDPRFARNAIHMVASAGLSLEAAAKAASARKVATHILSDRIEGEARDVGGVLAAIAREVRLHGRPFEPPVVLLSGGETTVTLRGRGKGGRNTEFLLAVALAIDGLDGIGALAADTDGINGSEDNAGAYADGTSVARMRAAGLDPKALLANNDAWSAFAAIGDLIMTGPTGTNVNDFRAILIEDCPTARGSFSPVRP